jgi:GntR family transcriptional regulator
MSNIAPGSYILYTCLYTMKTRASPLTVIVDRSSDEPVYEQIARQVRFAITSGDLGVGSVLPPVRTLASDLGVNLNTVARAYRVLEEEGFVRIQTREGAVVTSPASRIDAGSRERLCEELRLLLLKMRQAGFSIEELRGEVEAELDSLRSQSR